jgi:hypothetical protein
MPALQRRATPLTTSYQKDTIKGSKELPSKIEKAEAF